jgi:hypothetical protein
MKSEPSLFGKQHRLVIAGLLAMAALQPATAENTANGTSTANDTYTWSAELVAVDDRAGTVTVQSRLVYDAEVDFDSLDPGDRVTLTWSGINTAAGVRRITSGAAPQGDLLTLPIEFVSAELDNQYVRFKVAVPSDKLAKISSLSPGDYVTATSPRRGANFEEAVADLRPYANVG